MSDPKYKVGDRVRVNGWCGSATGTITFVDWIYHHRLYEHVWGYGVRYDDGQSNGLALNPVPQGYIIEVLPA